ncbi:MAG TPA: TIGR03067 domain-containing protein [Opitutaceae bacterium]
MLDGTWIPQGAEFGGQSLPLPPARFVIAGARYVVETGDARDEGVLRIDAAATPAAIDIVGTAGPNAGKTIPAIFRMRGELLQLCYEVSDTPRRPIAFGTAPGSVQLMVRYRREG